MHIPLIIDLFGMIDLQYYAFLHRVVRRPWARSWSKLDLVVAPQLGVVDYGNCGSGSALGWMWAEAHAMW